MPGKQKLDSSVSALPVTSTRVSNGLYLPILTGAALMIAAGAGMINDHVDPSPAITGSFALIAFPLAVLLAGIALACLPFSRTGRSVWGAMFPLFGFWCALSLLRTNYLWSGVMAVLLALAALAIGKLCDTSARNGWHGLLVVGCLCTAGGIVAAVGLNEYMGQIRAANPGWRVFANFVNPDFLAGYLLTIIPLTAVLFLAIPADEKRRPLLLLAGLGLTLQLLCMLLTQSRMGLAALLVGAIVSVSALLKSGRLAGPARRRAMIMGGLVLIVALGGIRPILHRLQASGAESHSGLFRLYTWQGTARMASANPVLGRGAGSFETAYPQYAITGYTQHAHNGYLQLAGEAGIPALVFLIISVGWIVAGGVRSLQENRINSEAINGWDIRLIQCGLLGSITAFCVHNLFDSDLYLPAIALSFGACCGLLRGFSGLKTGEEAVTQKSAGIPFLPRRALQAGGVLLALVSSMLIISRETARRAAEAAFEPDYARAISGYKNAASMDPLNPEYPLNSASLQALSGDSEGADRDYRRAISLAPIGKAYYRYGKFLQRHDNISEAVRQYEAACVQDPHSIQNLLALADGYRVQGKPARAVEAYRALTVMSEGPAGKIRAVPEVVDWEFGDAWLRLAEMAPDRNVSALTRDRLEHAVGILQQFWRGRGGDIARIRVRPDILLRAGRVYIKALQQLITECKQTGDITRANKLQSDLDTLESEMEAEQIAQEELTDSG